MFNKHKCSIFPLFCPSSLDGLLIIHCFVFLGSQGCNFAYNLGSDIGDSWSSGQPQDPGLPHPSPRIERGPSHHYAIIGNFPAEAKTDERDRGRLGSSGMSKVTAVVYGLS